MAKSALTRMQAAVKKCQSDQEKLKKRSADVYVGKETLAAKKRKTESGDKNAVDIFELMAS
eukprot:364004-Amphidinium_carterae.1